MKVLDSDFLVAVLRNEDGARKKSEEIKEYKGVLAITVLNAQEVFFGCLISSNPTENYSIAEKFLNQFEILDYNYNSMLETIKIKAALRRNGESIEILDEMIAGICLANNATLVTRNTRHFSKISGLKIEKW